MKKILLFPTLLLILFSFAACSSDDEDDSNEEQILIRETEFKIEDIAGSEAEIVFSVSNKWKTSINYEGTEKDWLTLSANSGAVGNQQQIIAKASANTTSKMRTAQVVLHCGRNSQTVTITQNVNRDADITTEFDPNFAKYLEERELISDATSIKARDVRELYHIIIQDNTKVTSVAGIEYFESLEYFYCNSAKIRDINFSKNSKLQSIKIQGSNLSSINVSKNTELKYLDCSGNNLDKIDLSNNTELTILFLIYNKLTSIDLSKNKELIELNCSSNELTKLDVSKNIKLESLVCTDNKLTTIDVSKNTELINLEFSNNNLTNIDIKNNKELTFLYCDSNLLTGLDISNNSKLWGFYCSYNPGENGKFVVKAWFDNDNIPFLCVKNWIWEGKEISSDYQKVK